jgi:carboxymethylenebutenolidase
MSDDDRMLDLPEPEFGSGIVGVCDICGRRQAVVVLTKERFKLCVLDFLNKSWLGSEKKPGVPAPLYRSDRVAFPTAATKSGTAPAIVLTPTKAVRHPVVLVLPDVYGITTTLLDGAIRFAREGFEVLIPDLARTEGIGVSNHLSMRGGAIFRGGVSVTSPKVRGLLALYRDALGYLLSRPMVDTSKSALFGVSYGASLALGMAAEETRLQAVVLAYPRPTRPRDVGRLVTAPVFGLAGARDASSARAFADLKGVLEGGAGNLTVVEIPGARHGFLSRDLGAYDVTAAENGWAEVLKFLKARLMPPPPRPPPPPVRTTIPTPPGAPTTVGAPAPRPASPPTSSPTPRGA